MKIVVTGGAGFIGSCVIKMLNNMGLEDIIIVDDINTTDKWLNIRNKKYSQYTHKKDFLEKINDFKEISHIIHMGACSSTTEEDFDYLYKNNYLYSCHLWEYAAKKQISFIYASSAATYGSGEFGFSDDTSINRFLPLNRYGYSKQLFDVWSQKQELRPSQYVGLKFFNVYGPNEYAKGSMASVVFHGYNQIMQEGKLSLFKSYNPKYSDGKQLRDFIYVKDVCNVINFFILNPNISGIFNVGTGVEESFYNLGKAIFSALNLEENIQFIDMPEGLKNKYQYYTKATIQKLINVGYQNKFYTLEEGIHEYVRNYLQMGNAIY